MNQQRSTIPSQPGWFHFLFDRIGKEGIFAILFCATLGLLLYGGWELAMFFKDQAAAYLGDQRTVMVKLSDANEKNAESTHTIADAVAELIGFHDLVAKQHDTMISSLTTMTEHIEGDEARDAVAADRLEKLIELMTVANQMMSAVPEQRDKEIVLLQKIDQGIQELRREMSGCPAGPPPVEPPDP